MWLCPPHGLVPWRGPGYAAWRVVPKRAVSVACNPTPSTDTYCTHNRHPGTKASASSIDGENPIWKICLDICDGESARALELLDAAIVVLVQESDRLLAECEDDYEEVEEGAEEDESGGEGGTNAHVGAEAGEAAGAGAGAGGSKLRRQRTSSLNAMPTEGSRLARSTSSNEREGWTHEHRACVISRNLRRRHSSRDSLVRSHSSAGLISPGGSAVSAGARRHSSTDTVGSLPYTLEGSECGEDGGGGGGIGGDGVDEGAHSSVSGGSPIMWNMALGMANGDQEQALQILEVRIGV